MKKLRSITAMVVVMVLMAGRSLIADEKKLPETAKTLEYNKKGFILGTELAGFIGFDEGQVIGAPGKVDLILGYQFNPYISIAADLWTFWFVAYAAEAQIKANFTDSKISPYAIGTAGVIGVINVFDDEEGGSIGLATYSAGLGVDFHLSKKGTLFTDLRYRGGTEIDDQGSANGIEIGVGYRWTF